jgi:ApbE superfamily uncharacterized protein (UPF0280 family)
MRPRILLAALATASAIALAAPAAAAQQSGAVMNRAPRVVATYSFGARRHAIAFPMTVIVADSAGTLVANARIAGEREPLPMMVTVLESDLILQTETRDGILTLVLDKQAQGDAPKVAAGRWSLGTAEGQLRARN